MAERLDQTPQESLGSEFWVQPDDAWAGDPHYSFIYSQVVNVLLAERGSLASGLDLMLIERLAKMYSYLRMREAFEDMTDRTRRELNKDWIELAVSLKKLWAADDRGEGTGAEKLLTKVNVAIKNAIKDLPPGAGQRAYAAIVDSFEREGL